MDDFASHTDATHWIWTTQGYLPIASLEHKPDWVFFRDGPDPSIVTEIHFVDEYFLNGKSVKRGVAICKPQVGVSAESTAAPFG